MKLPFAIEKDGLRLAVRLTPRGSRAALKGIVEGPDGKPALGVGVAAPPVEGAANAALIAFLAKTLGLPKSSISIHSGHSSRLKILILLGDGQAIAARLTGLIVNTDSSDTIP